MFEQRQRLTHTFFIDYSIWHLIIDFTSSETMLELYEQNGILLSDGALENGQSVENR